MGKDRRIRRYSTSRGFWGTESQPKQEPKTKRSIEKRTYLEKLLTCGDSINVFEVKSQIDTESGEIAHGLSWIGQISIPAHKVLPNIYDPGNPDRNRRSLMAGDIQQVEKIIETASGEKTHWKRKRHSKISMN